jgi:hypothetical protein
MHRNWGQLYYGTPAELALEPYVAAWGWPYRFQHPFFLFPGETKYFPDFFLPQQRVIIEVDDSGHFTPAGRKKDAVRTAALVKLGYKVVRCTNEEALFDPEGTVTRLMAEAGVPRRDTPPAPPR